MSKNADRLIQSYGRVCGRMFGLSMATSGQRTPPPPMWGVPGARRFARALRHRLRALGARPCPLAGGGTWLVRGTPCWTAFVRLGHSTISSREVWPGSSWPGSRSTTGVRERPPYSLAGPPPPSCPRARQSVPSPTPRAVTKTVRLSLSGTRRGRLRHRLPPRLQRRPVRGRCQHRGPHVGGKSGSPRDVTPWHRARPHRTRSGRSAAESDSAEAGDPWFGRTGRPRRSSRYRLRRRLAGDHGVAHRGPPGDRRVDRGFVMSPSLRSGARPDIVRTTQVGT